MGTKIYDMIIIGAGPAGLGAAIYAARAGFDVLVLEKNPVAGGQIINTSEVDNYPGLPGIGGFELGDDFRTHAEKLGVSVTNDEVTGMELEGSVKKISCVKNEYETRTVVLAMGARHANLNVPGESEFTGRGVSYCATCDGAFFRGRNVVVVGGGDTAVQDAIYLSNMCAGVTLVHRRDSLRAAASLQKALFAKENIKVEWNSVVSRIKGDGLVNCVCLRDVETGEERKLPAAGVFAAVGMLPQTDNIPECIAKDEKGYICAGEDTRTSVPGVFAAGDIRTKQVRQVITAVADGAVAVHSAEEYLLEQSV